MYADLVNKPKGTDLGILVLLRERENVVDVFKVVDVPITRKYWN
jgi:hypothetical protein